MRSARSAARVAEDGDERAPQVEEGPMLALRNRGLLNTTNDDY
jgi:hypothetical protein